MTEKVTTVAIKKDAEGKPEVVKEIQTAETPKPSIILPSSADAARLLALALPAMHLSVRLSQDATNAAFNVELVKFNAMKGKYDVDGQAIGKADKQTRNFVRALQQMEKAKELVAAHVQVQQKADAIPTTADKTPEPVKA